METSRLRTHLTPPWRPHLIVSSSLAHCRSVSIIYRGFSVSRSQYESNSKMSQQARSCHPDNAEDAPRSKKRSGEDRSIHARPPAKKQKQVERPAAENPERKPATKEEIEKYPSIPPISYVLETYFEDLFNRSNHIQRVEMSRDVIEAIFSMQMEESFQVYPFVEALCCRILTVPAQGIPPPRADGVPASDALAKWGVPSEIDQDGVLLEACSDNFGSARAWPQEEFLSGGHLNRLFSDPALFSFFIFTVLRICENVGLLNVKGFQTSDVIAKNIALETEKVREEISRNLGKGSVSKGPNRGRGKQPSASSQSEEAAPATQTESKDSRGKNSKKPPKGKLANAKKESGFDQEEIEPEENGVSLEGKKKKNLAQKPVVLLKIFVKPENCEFLYLSDGDKVEDCVKKAEEKHVGWQVTAEKCNPSRETSAKGEFLGGDGEEEDVEEEGKNDEGLVVFRWSYAVAVFKSTAAPKKTGTRSRSKSTSSASRVPPFSIKVLTATKVKELGMSFSLEKTRSTGATMRGGKTSKALASRQKNSSAQDRTKAVNSQLSQMKLCNVRMALREPSDDGEPSGRRYSLEKTVSIPSYPDNALPRGHKLKEYYTTNDFMSPEEMRLWISDSMVTAVEDDPNVEEQDDREEREEEKKERAQDSNVEKKEEKVKQKIQKTETPTEKKGEEKTTKASAARRPSNGYRTSENASPVASSGTAAVAQMPANSPTLKIKMAPALKEFSRPVDDFCKSVNDRVVPAHPAGWLEKFPKSQTASNSSTLDAKQIKKPPPPFQKQPPPALSRAEMKAILQGRTAAAVVKGDPLEKPLDKIPKEKKTKEREEMELEEEADYEEEEEFNKTNRRPSHSLHAKASSSNHSDMYSDDESG